jgi:capsular polysaccharide biosynthesis protein
MTSPTIELPQLSLQRYLDLVKRRRWQLVPVSLLGLIVGGLVAFFIPRYYVAETHLEHLAIPGELRSDIEDPFKDIVDNAQEAIPYAAREAMVALKWPEATASDPSTRTLVEKDVRSRIFVLDNNAGQRNRSYALLRVFYRDTDGQRAAALANAVAQAFIDQRVAGLRAGAEAAYDRANRESLDWSRTYEQLLLQKQQIEQRYRIEPDLDPVTQVRLRSEREAEHRAQQQRLQAARVDLALVGARVARTQEQLVALPERVAPDIVQLLAAAQKDPALAPLTQELVATRLAQQGWTVGSPGWVALQRRLAKGEATLRTALVTEVADENGLVPNPALAPLRDQLAADEPVLAKLRLEVAELEGVIAAAQMRIEQAIEGHAAWTKKRSDLDDAEANRRRAAAARDAQQEILARLAQQPPIRVAQAASIPPHPTEPNIVVVALIGCVLGLGVAIGLILLLDFLQGSFKTLDDVERGLPVPVLGGIAWFETAEQRRAVSRGRIRAAVAAFAFVGLVVVVVTIYYWDPTRLPPVVRDLLAVLLGG